MSCQGLTQGRGHQAQEADLCIPHPPLQSPVQPPAAFRRTVAGPQSPIHAPHTCQAPKGLAQDSRCGGGGGWGCSHRHIRCPGRLALAHPCREGQGPAAFLSAGLGPGSCHAWQLHLLPHSLEHTGCRRADNSLLCSMWLQGCGKVGKASCRRRRWPGCHSQTDRELCDPGQAPALLCASEVIARSLPRSYSQGC